MQALLQAPRIIWKYSRTHLQRTPRDDDFQFVITGVRYNRGYNELDKNEFVITGVSGNHTYNTFLTVLNRLLDIF